MPLSRTPSVAWCGHAAPSEDFLAPRSAAFTALGAQFYSCRHLEITFTFDNQYESFVLVACRMPFLPLLIEVPRCPQLCSVRRVQAAARPEPVIEALTVRSSHEEKQPERQRDRETEGQRDRGVKLRVSLPSSQLTLPVLAGEGNTSDIAPSVSAAADAAAGAISGLGTSVVPSWMFHGNANNTEQGGACSVFLKVPTHTCCWGLPRHLNTS